MPAEWEQLQKASGCIFTVEFLEGNVVIPISSCRMGGCGHGHPQLI